MCCHVTLTVLLKIKIAMHIHSFVFHNEKKKIIRISVLVQQQLIIIKQEPLPSQTSQVSHMQVNIDRFYAPEMEVYQNQFHQTTWKHHL